MSLSVKQKEAVNFTGRKLSDEELYIAMKGVDAGLSFDIETVLHSAIEEAIRVKSAQ